MSKYEIILGGGGWEIEDVCLRQLRFSQPLEFRSPNFLLIPSNGNESVGVTAGTFSGVGVKAANRPMTEDSKDDFFLPSGQANLKLSFIPFYGPGGIWSLQALYLQAKTPAF